MPQKLYASNENQISGQILSFNDLLEFTLQMDRSNAETLVPD